MGRHGPPVVTKADSSLLSGGAKQPSSKVAVAPPLGPYRYSAPAPQDAANTAWRLYAAPEAPVPAKGPAPTRAKPPRPAGGLAPPHLDAPVSLNARRS